MSVIAGRNRLLLLGLGLALVASVGYLAIRSRDRTLTTDPETYEAMTRTFYRALAHLDVGLLDNARQEFTRATELVPDEPAAWANLSLAQVRLGEFDNAVKSAARAAELAPGNSDIELLQGRMEVTRGQLDEGIAHLRRAVDLNPGNLRSRFALAQEIERAGVENADALAQQQLDELLRLRPDNLAVLLERARLAAKQNDLQTLQESVGRLQKFSGSWPALAQEQYRSLQSAVAAQNPTEAARSVAFLRNVLAPVPTFRESLTEVRTPVELIAEPFRSFLRLPQPSAMPSPPDGALTFSSESLGSDGTTTWRALIAITLNGKDIPAVFAANDREVRRLDAVGAPLVFSSDAAVTPRAPGLVALDWNHDFRMDLAVAGQRGVRLFTQTDVGSFTDATPRTDQTAALTADCFGVWTADLEMDGDLDLIVGVNGASPMVLRNNGDGTWRQLQTFAAVSDLRAFAWGDLDRDGDPDAALVDGLGNLRLFENRQAGDFRPLSVPASSQQVSTVTIGDSGDDGVLDLLTLDTGGSIRRAFLEAGQWVQEELVAWPDRGTDATVGSSRLFLADLDNNGALDLIASIPGRSGIWLAGVENNFSPLLNLPEEVFGVADLGSDGQLDLVALAGGKALRLQGRGTKGYHWQVIRPRAQPTAGDQRINTFGVGGEIQIRSGLLTQKQILTGPVVHFGLGSRTSIDVARISWPNGVVQAEFDPKVDQVLVSEQRLKGSCPWVFGFDGANMRFVTDFLWRSPLGLRINAQDTAGVTQTEDWVKIRGDQLAPKDGFYDLRITAELWETHFVDHVSLMAVDHPRDVEVFVDERFSSQAPSLAVHALHTPQAVSGAWDESGREVTDLVAAQDERYVATFARGPYQGVAQDHFVEVDLGPESSGGRPEWLLAHGWIYPTDSSINVAIGQGQRARPRGLSLEAKRDDGRWIVVAPDLGFPAGKNKTILIDLRQVSRAGIERARRLRLRTNMEIYWDWLAVASNSTEGAVKTVRLHGDKAELRYRGFSRTTQDRRDVPEIPEYAALANIGQRWRDLVGYYTRFGDVRELVDRVDDRYVIMNAGDELQLLFPVLPPPPAGWKRDFVLIGDGWVKDGDYNTTSSKTVGPLPQHSQPDHEASSTVGLDDDPIYRHHPRDWQTFHTRFVTPDRFLSGLKHE
jgi:tetratricopeptide (TPR) repeat protein